MTCSPYAPISNLSAVSGDDPEHCAGHVHGDVVGGEVGAKQQAKPDVPLPGSGVAVDRNYSDCVSGVSDVGP